MKTAPGLNSQYLAWHICILYMLTSTIIVVVTLPDQTIKRVTSVQIFEKALDEPKYSSMYAQLCKRLAEQAPNFESPDAKVSYQN